MNLAAQTYWNEYWAEQDQVQPKSVSAWQFGDEPDYLAHLVIDGIKTATCSGYIFYELENEPLPKKEDYSVILNSDDEPVAIIKTVKVTLTPMDEVTEDFAFAEGEGDKTYEYWWDTHVRFFSNALHSIGREFSEDMLLVCERFEVVDVKSR